MDDGELFLEDSPESAVIYEPSTSDTTSSSPANGLLAILGVVAGAGALTLTATAIAKKKEQEAQKAQALANLQPQQATQALNATANWDANQLKQTEATETVMLAGKQSQANKNYWAAYAIWKVKAAQAEQLNKIKNFLVELRALLESKQRTSMTNLVTFLQGVGKLALGFATIATLLLGTGLIAPAQTGSAKIINAEGTTGITKNQQGCTITMADVDESSGGCWAFSNYLSSAKEYIARYVEMTRVLAQAYGPAIIRTGRVVDIGLNTISGNDVLMPDIPLTEIDMPHLWDIALRNGYNIDNIQLDLDQLFADGRITIDEISILEEMGLWDDILGEEWNNNVMYSGGQDDWIRQEVSFEDVDTSDEHWWEHKADCWSETTGLDATEISKGRYQNRLLDIVRNIMNRPTSVYIQNSGNYVWVGSHNNMVLHIVINPATNRLIQTLFFRNDGNTRHPCS